MCGVEYSVSVCTTVRLKWVMLNMVLVLALWKDLQWTLLSTISMLTLGFNARSLRPLQESPTVSGVMYGVSFYTSVYSLKQDSQWVVLKMVSVLVLRFKAGGQTYHRGVNRASGSSRGLLSGVPQNIMARMHKGGLFKIIGLFSVHGLK